MPAREESGGAKTNPDNSPEEERGRRRKQSHGSETEKPGDGIVAGGAKIRQALRNSTGQYLLSGYLMTLVKKKNKNVCFAIVFLNVLVSLLFIFTVLPICVVFSVS